MEFDPKNHYWRAEDGRVFSSASMALVAEDGSAFQAWLRAGGELGTWPRDEDGAQTQAALDDVLRHYSVVFDPVAMPDISDRQFGAGLWGDKIISFEACEAFVSIGTIPEPLQAIVDALPDDDTGEPSPRKDAIIFIKGAKTYVFAHPLVDVIRQAQGWTAEHLRERWSVWAAL